MYKFSIGDRVRITQLMGYYPDTRQGLWVNNTGTVTKLNDNGSYHVRTDNAEKPTPSHSETGWAFFEEELEAVDNG